MNEILHYIFIDIGTFLLTIALVGFIYWDYSNRRKKRMQRKGKELNESDLRYEKFSLIILKSVGILFCFNFFFL